MSGVHTEEHCCMHPEKDSFLKKQQPGKEGEGSHPEVGVIDGKASCTEVPFPPLTPKCPWDQFEMSI